MLNGRFGTAECHSEKDSALTVKTNFSDRLATKPGGSVPTQKTCINGGSHVDGEIRPKVSIRLLLLLLGFGPYEFVD